MAVFPETSYTLIKKLSADVTSVSEAAWVRFFDLYVPVMRRFVEWNDKTRDPDDVVQDVLVKLLDAVRKGRYDPGRAKFRTFLATVIRNHLVSLYRKDAARGAGSNVSFEELLTEPSVPASQGDALDLAWARARHEAAVEHVLTKTALSVQTKSVYRAYVIEGRPIDEVEREFGVSRDVIYKIKFRVDSAIAVIEEEYADENAETPSGD